MFGGPLGDAPSIGVLCSYIKRGVVGARALGKRKCPSDTREPRPHEQDLDNHILLCKTNGIDYVPTPNPHRNGLNLSPVGQVSLFYIW